MQAAIQAGRRRASHSAASTNTMPPKRAIAAHGDCSAEASSGQASDAPPTIADPMPALLADMRNARGRIAASTPSSSTAIA